MTQRSKNLLEAFKASSQEERPGVLPRRAMPAPKADDPFAVDTAGAKEPPPRPRALHERAAAATLHSYVPALVLAVLALVGLAYWLGKISKSDQVSAGDRSKPEVRSGKEDQLEAKQAAPDSALTAPPTTATKGDRPAVTQTAFPASDASASSGQTRAEEALKDKNNKYTVVMAEYTRDRDNAIAEQTLAYVSGQGIPAALTYMGTRLFLVAGAAPDQKSLEGLVKSAKALRGPPPLNRQGEFHDAYLNSIDKILKR